MADVVNWWWSKSDLPDDEDFLCDQAARALGWIEAKRAR